MKAGERGFSLMEVLLAVIIVGVLVSIAVPNYIRSAERARGREAIATLDAMMAAELTYAAERRIFVALNNNNDFQAVGMENPNNNAGRSFNYSLAVNGTGTAFTGTATRIGPINALETVTIDENGNIAGTFTP